MRCLHVVERLIPFDVAPRMEDIIVRRDEGIQKDLKVISDALCFLESDDIALVSLQRFGVMLALEPLGYSSL